MGMKRLALKHQSAIILLGPMGAGKITIGWTACGHAGHAQAGNGRAPLKYYEEIGYSDEGASRRHWEGGIEAVLRYGKPFEAYDVERLLVDRPLAVIAFGAGHSVFEDETLFERVRVALEPFPNVVLLLPSPDIEESLRILAEREPGGAEMNEHFLQHPSNVTLAKLTVYTKDKTPEDTRDEILRLITLPSER